MIKTLYKGNWVSLKQRGTWEYIERNNNNEAAIILPILEDYDTGEMSIVLIKEWRPILQRYVLGVPAGLVGDHGDEEPIEAAKRELLEETGYKAGTMTFLFKGPSSSGLGTEMLNFFKAEDLELVSDKVGVDGEQIEVVKMPINKDYYVEEPVIKYTREHNLLLDPKVFIALCFLTN